MTGLPPERWLEDHPYLRPIAGLCASVERAVSEVGPAPVAVPAWEVYREDFEAGVPLLSSPSAAVSLEPSASAVGSLVRRLEAERLPGPIAGEVSALATALARSPELSHQVVPFLLGDDSVEPPAPGILKFLGWTVLARSLSPVVEAFAAWRDEGRWLRRYCPTCGASPAMAQIAGMDPARLRLLYCSRCRTRWRFRRTQCPFCENDSQRLTGIKVEGEPALRIDHCGACRGYLKTYDGQGDEALFLSDWTSLHLDLLAHERGLERRAASLYDLGSLVGG